MKTITTPVTFHLNPESNQRLAGLCGEYNFNLKQVEERLGVKISNRGHLFCIDGRSDAVKQAGTVLQALYRDTETDPALTAEKVHLAISQIPYDEETGDPETQDVVIRFRKTIIQGRNPNQRSYLRNIMAHDLTFGIGPAGTGKTYLAVACAVQALANNEVDRIVLVRPAIEAGERLGFLPGDIGQKVDPYLRPLYDALYEMLGF
ncbi:MAG: PhoH family protein, partial [Pseudomonadota bacterium]